MLSPYLAIAALGLYTLCLFAVALFAERRSDRTPPAWETVFYCLAFACYHTAWSMFGTVGEVFTSGFGHLSTSLGPLVSCFLWWILLRKLVRLKNRYRITSLPDFISTRYSKSTFVGLLATVICLFTIIPYIALQLRSVATLYDILSGFGGSPPVHTVGLAFAVAMGVFTILFGLRKIDPTEHHAGLVASIAVESVLKLAAMVVVGVFVTWFLFDGVADLFERAQGRQALALIMNPADGMDYSSWFASLVMSFFAILLLPRQFYLTVVENSDERHILSAMWFVPLYMLLITVFVIPIAIAGTLLGLDPTNAEYFTAKIPVATGQPWLALLVFIGGYSAAASMIISGLTAVSLVFNNYIVLPLADSLPLGANLRKNQRLSRWLSAIVILAISYFFMISAGATLSLQGAGSRAFAAIMQVVPAAIGGLLWRRANRTGALLGMGSGLLIWCYTLLLPLLERTGLPISVLQNGPFGIRMLHPEALFGVTGLEPVPHALFWSFSVNFGLWILGSLWSQSNATERIIADDFHLFGPKLSATQPQKPVSLERLPVGSKLNRIRTLLLRYLPAEEAERILTEALETTRLSNQETLSLEESAALLSEVERRLSGAIGSAWAHRVIETSDLFDKQEIEALGQVYGRALANMQISPIDLQRRIDYYREREALLVSNAAELERRIKERDYEINLRQRAEAAQARLNSIVEATSDFVAMFDLTGRVFYKNKSMIKQVGRNASSLGDLYAPEDEKSMREVAMPKAAQVGLWQGESRLKGSATSSDVIISQVVIAHRGPDGALEYFSALARDISEQKRIEASLLHAKDVAEAAGRLKSEFVATVSHELRTPLNGIIGGTDLLIGERDPVAQIKSIDLIRRNAKALSALIDDILTYSQTSAGQIRLKPETFSIRELVGDSMHEHQSTAESKGVEVRLHMASEVPDRVYADRGRLRQVLMNLIGNAVKFTPTGGVDVRVAQENQERVRFEIEDTGVGIPQDALEKLFRPFSQVDSSLSRRYGGTGMGLAICKRLVEAMGGQIWVTSEVGRGTKFWFSIPLPAAKGEQRIEHEEPKPALVQPGFRILLADDSIDNQIVVRRLLKKIGCDCDVVNDGVEAVEAVQERDYDLILMDIMMPRMNGLEAIKIIRERGDEKAHVVIIALTARVMKEDCDAYMGAGANEVIAKPVDLATLKSALVRAQAATVFA